MTRTPVEFLEGLGVNLKPWQVEAVQAELVFASGAVAVTVTGVDRAADSSPATATVDPKIAREQRALERVRAAHDEGLTNPEIARRLNLSLTRVGKILRKDGRYPHRRRVLRESGDIR